MNELVQCICMNDATRVQGRDLDWKLAGAFIKNLYVNSMDIGIPN